MRKMTQAAILNEIETEIDQHLVQLQSGMFNALGFEFSAYRSLLPLVAAGEKLSRDQLAIYLSGSTNLLACCSRHTINLSKITRAYLIRSCTHTVAVNGMERYRYQFIIVAALLEAVIDAEPLNVRWLFPPSPQSELGSDATLLLLISSMEVATMVRIAVSLGDSSMRLDVIKTLKSAFEMDWPLEFLTVELGKMRPLTSGRAALPTD